MPPALFAVIEGSRGNGLDLLYGNTIEGLRFGGEDIPLPEPGDIKRLYAERIAGGNNPVFRCQHKGEHTVEFVDPAVVAGSEQMQHGLAVRGGFEKLWSQNGPKIVMIVDFAVDDEQIIALVDRLSSVFGSDDG